MVSSFLDQKLSLNQTSYPAFHAKKERMIIKMWLQEGLALHKKMCKLKIVFLSNLWNTFCKDVRVWVLHYKQPKLTSVMKQTLSRSQRDYESGLHCQFNTFEEVERLCLRQFVSSIKQTCNERKDESSCLDPQNYTVNCQARPSLLHLYPQSKLTEWWRS